MDNDDESFVAAASNLTAFRSQNVLNGEDNSSRQLQLLAVENVVEVPVADKSHQFLYGAIAGLHNSPGDPYLVPCRNSNPFSPLQRAHA